MVDDTGRLSGFVSLFDLEREHFERGDTGALDEAPLMARSRGYDYRLPAGFHADPIAHATVREVMARQPLAIPWSTPLATAAAMMAFEHLEALPVVNEVGEVAGVLFALDVVRWLAGHTSDGDPRRRAHSS